MLEQQAAEALGAPADQTQANAPFTADELVEVKRSLEEIRELIVGSAELSDPQIADLDARVRYLESTAEHSPRIDWWNILVGQLVQFVAQWAMGGDLLRTAIQTATSALGRFFGVPTSADLPRLGSPE